MDGQEQPRKAQGVRATEDLRRRLRTTKMLERVNQEIHRRTRSPVYWVEASLLSLATAIQVEISEEWETGLDQANE